MKDKKQVVEMLKLMFNALGAKAVKDNEYYKIEGWCKALEWVHND